MLAVNGDGCIDLVVQRPLCAQPVALFRRDGLDVDRELRLRRGIHLGAGS